MVKTLITAQQARTVLARALLTALALGIWFWTQSLIGKKSLPATGPLGDALHDLSVPLNLFLHNHPAWADALLLVSSGLIDAIGLFLLAKWLFGPSVRPFLALVLILALRQVFQWLCTLPPPQDMIWHDPGFPSLFVTYGVSNDFFFSGHSALAVLGALEVGRLGRPWLTATAVVVALFEMAAVLVLRAHYTMDVFAGTVTALYVAHLAARLSPVLDRFLAGFRTSEPG